MKIALLGMAQAGRRTLFELLTGRKVPEGMRESETLVGVAPVRDPRVDEISRIIEPKKQKYAEIEYELCPAVEDGSGKRAWADPARRCDALCFVVRAFRASDVYHARGSVDAVRDHDLLNTELLVADLDAVEKRLERIRKEKKNGQTPQQAVEEKALEKCSHALQGGTPLHGIDLEAHERTAVANLGLLTLKPVMWVYNVDDDEATSSAEGGVLKIACKIEREIAAIESPSDRSDFLSALGLELCGVDRMNAAAYDRLGLMSFYTMGKDEVRAWTIRKGWSAPQAAGRVHSDMERGFIRAEVIRYDDLLAAGSEAAVRQQGKVSLKGKDYVVADGDICAFLFSV